MNEQTTGEANRQCYLTGTKTDNCDCYLCGYQNDCSVNNSGEETECESCKIQN